LKNAITYNNVLNSNIIKGELCDATPISNVVDKIDLGTFTLTLESKTINNMIYSESTLSLPIAAPHDRKN